MTERQIALVKKTWKIYREIDPVLIGDVFYSKLFSDAPALRSMFTTERAVQSKKLVDMLSMIMGRLDKLEQIREDIKQLGLRHKSYGVKISHYDLVGNALLWTLQQGLGREWTEEVAEAWRLCYDTFSGVMKEGAS